MTMLNINNSIFPPEVADFITAKSANSRILAKNALYVDALISTLLEDEDEINQRVAAAELGDLLAVAFLPEAAQALIAAARPQEQQTPLVRERAISALGRMRSDLADQETIRQVVTALSANFSDPIPEIRREAVRAVGRQAGPRINLMTSLNDLLAILQDPTDAVRLAAVVALCPIARDPVVRQALYAIAEADPSTTVRAEAEGVIQDTRPLKEKVAIALKKTPEAVGAWLAQPRAQITGAPALATGGAYRFAQEESVETIQKGEFDGYRYLLRQNGDLVVDTRLDADDKPEVLVLITLRDERLENIMETGGTIVEDPPTYLMLSRQGNWAVGTVKLHPKGQTPVSIVPVESEDITPDIISNVISCYRAQIDAHPQTLKSWRSWVERLPDPTRAAVEKELPGG